MKHKKLFITLIALFSFAVCLGTFIIIWFWGDQYGDFSDFMDSVSIPGLDEGAVPQGLCNYTTDQYGENGEKLDKQQEYYFISAYMKEGPSRIYVTAAKTGYVGYVTLKNTDGSDLYGHCGGIATSCRRTYTNGTLWIASDGKVFCARSSNSEIYKNIAEEVIARARLYNTPDENGQAQNVITFKSSFEANCNSDFCFYYDSDGDPTTYNSTNDKFYVGEFYRPKSSETDSRHHVTTNSGAQNRAFAYEYAIDGSNGNYGLRTLTDKNLSDDMRVPKIQCVYSIPEKIQGFARIHDGSSTSNSKGKLVLSQSWGLSNSTLCYYDWEKIRSNSKRYGSLVKNVDGNDAGLEYKGVLTSSGAKVFEDPTVYFVDDNSLEREYSIPSMSEGLCANGNKIYVLFESASYKYKHFVRQQLKNIYYFIPRQ